MKTASLSQENGRFDLPLGRRGEMAGWGYLLRRGYKILEKNYRCPVGEMDVIAVRKGRMAFIEIKTRSGDHFGKPEESVHRSKQQKLIRVARWYLKEKGKENLRASFEVLAVTWKGRGDPEFRMIENAFEVPEEDGHP